MVTTFINPMAVLSDDEKRQLQQFWSAFQGTSKDYDNERSKLVGVDGKLKAEWLSPQGYRDYHESYNENGNMVTTFINAMAVLSDDEKRQLQQFWSGFHGTSKDYDNEISRLVGVDGKLKAKWLSPQGYRSYHESYNENGNMKSTFINAMAVLSKDEKRQLQQFWSAFHGRSKDYDNERSKLVGVDGKLKAEWLSPQGYRAYHESFNENGNMMSTFINAMAVLSDDEKRQLQQFWSGFHGRSKDYDNERSRLVGVDGKLKAEWLSPQGYRSYHESYNENGNMKSTFINAMAVLSDDEKRQLQQFWSAFHGRSKDYDNERSKLVGVDGKLKAEWLSPQGYRSYHESYNENGNMMATFKNAMAVLSDDEKRQLQQFWSGFHGTSKDYDNERSRLVGVDGKLKAEWLSPQGYRDYHESFNENGNMKSTFINAMAVLSDDEKRQLQQFWSAFHGRSKDYDNERSKLVGFDGKLKTEWLSPQGYRAYHESFNENGNMVTTFINPMAVLSDDEKRQLQQFWSAFQGTSEDWDLYRLVILMKNNSSQINAKYYFKEGLELAVSDIFNQYKSKGISLKASIKIVRDNVRSLFSKGVPDNRFFWRIKREKEKIPYFRTIYHMLYDDLGQYIPRYNISNGIELLVDDILNHEKMDNNKLNRKLVRKSINQSISGYLRKLIFLDQDYEGNKAIQSDPKITQDDKCMDMLRYLNATAVGP
ncbi:MAG: hypothetical protein IPL83_12345 [Bdellovibrionales bacterium]|nr:hypothetical protein [Bdellovibrionales bacterium]